MSNGDSSHFPIESPEIIKKIEKLVELVIPVSSKTKVQFWDKSCDDLDPQTYANLIDTIETME
jgi:hypothetical protein